MNNASVFVSDLAIGSGKTIIEEVIKLVVFSVVGAALSYLGFSRLFVTFSFRFRLLLTFGALTIPAVAAVFLSVNPWLIVAFLVTSFGIASYVILKNLSAVGLLAAFPTTSHGITPADSLKMVKSSLLFLGTGGGKLTDSPEFAPMLERVKRANGSLRLLLSDPDNPALMDMARQNRNHDLTYQGRVKESIRNIQIKTNAMGIPCEIRLYSLNQTFALPHFRLFFSDDSTCIFSQLIWNSSEGADNPQLILRRAGAGQESSLYLGYLAYFESLWTSSSTKAVDQATIDSWA